MNNTIKKILIPTDFSEGSKIAARYALQMAKTYNAEVELFHSFNFDPYVGITTTTWVTGTMIEDAEEMVREKLIATAKEMESDVKINYHLDTYSNHPSEAICNYIQKEGIDLVVIAKHSRKGIDRLLLGSVTEKVIRKSSCPVLVIPVYENKE